MVDLVERVRNQKYIDAMWRFIRRSRKKDEKFSMMMLGNEEEVRKFKPTGYVLYMQGKENSCLISLGDINLTHLTNALPSLLLHAREVRVDDEMR